MVVCAKTCRDCRSDLRLLWAASLARLGLVWSVARAGGLRRVLGGALFVVGAIFWLNALGEVAGTEN